MESWFVYIVAGRTGLLYTGITTDVARRVHEHNTSPRGARWCRAHRPVTLVWQTSAPSRSEATRLEVRIKRMPRPRKLALIAQG